MALHKSNISMKTFIYINLEYHYVLQKVFVSEMHNKFIREGVIHARD